MTLTHVNGFFDIFGTNSTDKVRNQKTLYYASSNNFCFCTTWQNGKHKKLKNVSPSSFCNFSIHELVMIIFGRHALNSHIT